MKTVENIGNDEGFKSGDWQRPESDIADIGVFPCESCSFLYDAQTMDYCPRCGRGASENE